MPSFFYNLGLPAAPHLAKANRLLKEFSGNEEEKIGAEFDLGAHLASAYRAQVPLDDDPTVVDFLARITPRLVESLPHRKLHWKVKFVQGSESNALAFPSGFIFLTRRLLELCDFQEDETAFILGHEKGHLVCRHVMDKYLAS